MQIHDFSLPAARLRHNQHLHAVPLIKNNAKRVFTFPSSFEANPFQPINTLAARMSGIRINVMLKSQNLFTAARFNL